MTPQEKETMLKSLEHIGVVQQDIRGAGAEAAQSLRLAFPEMDETEIGRVVYHISALIGVAARAAGVNESLVKMAAVFTVAGLDLAAESLIHD